ncbi:MAG TPA: serine hydrolase domain-containing protein [Chitinophagaceae bacterium]
MRKYIFCYLVAFATLFIGSCQNKGASYNGSSAYNEIADSLQKAEKLPGIFIGILDNGKRTYYSAGFADPDKKMVFDSATLFEIGSISKTFTAYILESVLKEKNISDSNSIISYLPDSVRSNTLLEKISFYNLLNHSSGLPRLPENMDLTSNPMSPYDGYYADHLFSYLKTCTPRPDGKSNFSNLGAGLAGVLAQRIAGKPYESLLAQYIFQPFSIKQHPDSTIAATTNKAQGYFTTINNQSPYWFADVLAPAGGLKCSADEILSYLEKMAAPENGSSQQIIEHLLTPTITVTPEIKVCRAWHTMEKKDSPVIYWHNGGTYGFSTFAGFLKEKKKAVVIVVNQFNKNKVSDKLGFSILEKITN